MLTPGLGAVSTTLMAGVELVRQGAALPVGSLTQMGTIRLAKRTEASVPRIKDFVPLANLDDIVFGGWDVYPDNAYQAATKAGEYIFQPKLYPELYGKVHHKVRIEYYPPRGDKKEGWDNIDIFGWLNYPMQIKVDFLCRDSILAAPIVLDLALFFDLANRAGMRGIQEWLSFYFKSPMCAPELYPEHDLFIQLMKLKNTLRWMMGEELITHLGAEYYD